MKELEKTKRISIAAVISILIVAIGLLSYKRPIHTYALTTASTLTEIQKNVLIEFDQRSENSLLIDVRNQYDFEKGHLDEAINISTHTLLNDTNKTIFDQAEIDQKAIVLYGTTPEEALIPYMMLLQLGYTNIQMLSIDLSYTQNKLIWKSRLIEIPAKNIQKHIDESVKKAAVKPRPKPVKKPVKKVVPKKKKKKMPLEGGC